jgi:hypothetical protein
MNKQILTTIIAAIIAGVVGYLLGGQKHTEVLKPFELKVVSNQNTIGTLTKPIDDVNQAKLFTDTFQNIITTTKGIFLWPTVDGKYIKSWNIDLKYIDNIATELRNIPNTTSTHIRIYPVINSDKNFSLMIIGGYTLNDGKYYNLRNKFSNGIETNNFAPMYDFIDPCPNKCPENDF